MPPTLLGISDLALLLESRSPSLTSRLGLASFKLFWDRGPTSLDAIPWCPISASSCVSCSRSLAWRSSCVSWQQLWVLPWLCSASAVLIALPSLSSIRAKSSISTLISFSIWNLLVTLPCELLSISVPPYRNPPVSWLTLATCTVLSATHFVGVVERKYGTYHQVAVIGTWSQAFDRIDVSCRGSILFLPFLAWRWAELCPAHIHHYNFLRAVLFRLFPSQRRSNFYSIHAHL